MEYVGGTSLNDLVKQRTNAAGWRRTRRCRSTRPSPTWSRCCRRSPTCTRAGLLYCDFKPANVIQVGESVKLIDLGGVRRIGDDESPIYGTVGFQAPEVAARRHDDRLGHLHGRAARWPCWSSSSRARPSEYVDSPADARAGPAVRRARLAVPAAAAGDGAGARGPLPVRRRAARATARRAARGHVARRRRLPLGAVDVLRDAGHLRRRARLGGAAGTACRHRRSDGLVAGRSDVRRPGATAGAARRARPNRRAAVRLARADAALGAGDACASTAECEALLQADPWDWRAVWLTGVAALAAGDVPGAVSAFNAVYGQVPGELAPKLALARACELADEREMAAGLYAVCSRTDGAYLARRPVRPGPPGPGRRPDRAMPSPRWAASRRSAGRTAKRAGSGRRCSSATARRRRTTSLRRRWRSTEPGSPSTRASRAARSRSSKPPWPRPRTMAVNHATQVVGVHDDRAGRAPRARARVPIGGRSQRRPRRADRAGGPGQRGASALARHEHAHMSDVTTSTLEACPACGQADRRRRRVLRVVRSRRSTRLPRSNRRPTDVDLDDTQPVEIDDRGNRPRAPSCARRAAARSSRTGSARPAAPSSRRGATTSPSHRPTWSPASATRASVATATRTRWRMAVGRRPRRPRGLRRRDDGAGQRSGQPGGGARGRTRRARRVRRLPRRALLAAVGHWSDAARRRLRRRQPRGGRRRPDTRRPAGAAVVHVRRRRRGRRRSPPWPGAATRAPTGCRDDGDGAAADGRPLAGHRDDRGRADP